MPFDLKISSINLNRRNTEILLGFTHKLNQQKHEHSFLETTS